MAEKRNFAGSGFTWLIIKIGEKEKRIKQTDVRSRLNICSPFS